MPGRTHARRLPVLWLALALGGCGGRAEPPLVLVVVFDAASARYLGSYGDTRDTTPHLDRLAAESVVFEHASSQSPTTPPSTASLLTGVRVTTHRMTSTGTLDESLVTLPLALRSDGFHSYAVVANPLAAAPELGFARDYDVSSLIRGRLRDSGAAGSPKGGAVPGWTARRRGQRPIPWPEDVNEGVIDLLPRLQQGPSFLYVHYLQPHQPYDPPEEYLALYGVPGEPSWETLEQQRRSANETGLATPTLVEALEARYRANLRQADAGFGALRGLLEDAGLWDGALVVVLADHGEAFFQHERFGHNTHLYDDMTHIPFLIRPPLRDGIAPRRVEQPVETIDLLPTVLDALDLPVPPQAEGDSLWPLVTGGQATFENPEVITSTMTRDQHAIRLGTWKYIRGPAGSRLLFDLAADPDESRSLTDLERERVRALDERLSAVVDAAGNGADPGRSNLWEDAEMRGLLEELGYVEPGVEPSPAPEALPSSR